MTLLTVPNRKRGVKARSAVKVLDEYSLPIMNGVQYGQRAGNVFLFRAIFQGPIFEGGALKGGEVQCIRGY